MNVWLESIESHAQKNNSTRLLFLLIATPFGSKANGTLNAIFLRALAKKF
jgi:hypothetical protein